MKLKLNFPSTFFSDWLDVAPHNQRTPFPPKKKKIQLQPYPHTDTSTNLIPTHHRKKKHPTEDPPSQKSPTTASTSLPLPLTPLSSTAKMPQNLRLFHPGVSGMKNMFDKKVEEHKQAQLDNPFSEWEGAGRTRRLSKEDIGYGRLEKRVCTVLRVTQSFKNRTRAMDPLPQKYLCKENFACDVYNVLYLLRFVCFACVWDTQSIIK